MVKTSFSPYSAYGAATHHIYFQLTINYEPIEIASLGRPTTTIQGRQYKEYKFQCTCGYTVTGILNEGDAVELAARHFAQVVYSRQDPANYRLGV